MVSPNPNSKRDSLSPRRSHGASRLPVVSDRSTSASPGKLGERYPSFQPSTSLQPPQRSRLSRIPTATTPKYSSTAPNSSPASRGARGPATSRLATIVGKSAESVRSPSRLGLQGDPSKNSGNDIPSNEASEYSEETPYATGMDLGSCSEKPLPRPPSGARYSQQATFIPRFSDVRGTSPEHSMSEGPEADENWSVNSSATLLHREHESGEELGCSSTPKAKESGIPSATPSTIVRNGTIKTTTDFTHAPCSSINIDSTSILGSPLQRFQESIPYPEAFRKTPSTSNCKSYNPNSTMSSQKDTEPDHTNTGDTPSVTPKARPVKPNPFRDRLQSVSPGTAPQTPLGTSATAFSYDFDEGAIDQSPTPTSLPSRKAGIPVPAPPSKENSKTEPPPRTAKRKSRIPRISSPKSPLNALNGGINKEGAETLQESQGASAVNVTEIPFAISLGSNNNVANGPGGIPSAVAGSKEDEDLSTSHATSADADGTGELEIREARAVTATRVSKGGIKLKQLSIAGRPDGPTLRIDPDAERIIMGTEKEEEDKKAPKRRSGAMRNIRRSTDSLLSSYLASKRSRKSSTDNAAEVPMQAEAQPQPRSFLPVKNLDIVKESPTPARRTGSHKMSIRTVSEMPKENVSPYSTQPSVGIKSPNGNMTPQLGSSCGEFKDVESSTRRRETHTLKDRINVNTPIKYSPPIPATPGKRAAKVQVPTSGGHGKIPVRQANYASPRTPRRQPNERMTFERMGFNNAPSAATPYTSNPTLRTVPSETRHKTPKEHFTATTRKSRIPSAIPKAKTRGVFQGFRGLFTKNKTSDSKATFDTAIGNGNGFANGHGIIGSSTMMSYSPSQRPNPEGADLLPTTQSPINMQVPNLRLTHSGPRIDDSPAMQDISSISNLTMDVLAAARRESEVSKKQKLISIGQILIATAAACHEAEAAMLRTLQGFKDAEVACAKTKENALKMTQVVRELADEGLPQSSH